VNPDMTPNRMLLDVSALASSLAKGYDPLYSSSPLASLELQELILILIRMVNIPVLNRLALA
jgi:hypothetical protein